MNNEVRCNRLYCNRTTHKFIVLINNLHYIDLTKNQAYPGVLWSVGTLLSCSDEGRYTQSVVTILIVNTDHVKEYITLISTCCTINSILFILIKNQILFAIPFLCHNLQAC